MNICGIIYQLCGKIQMNGTRGGVDNIFTYLVVVQTFSEYSVSFFFGVNNKCRRANVKYDLAFVVTYRARVCES